MRSLAPAERYARIVVCFIAAALSLRSASLHAQPPERLPLVVYVVDKSGIALEGAEITLKRGHYRDLIARTGSTGQARFPEFPAGVWDVLIRRVGMRSFSASLEIAGGSVEFTLLAQGSATA